MSNQTERTPELNQKRMVIVYEAAVKELASPSHDRHHIDITLTRAKELAAWCLDKGKHIDWEVLYAACCLHDLGRNDPNLKGLASVEASVQQARPILSACGYSPEESKKICEIIQDHDQPDLLPRTLEGLILKEADFLAGFDAWGIYRIIAWGIECRRSTEEIIANIRNKIPKRIASLQLPPSRRIAWEGWTFANMFLAQLEKQKKHQEREDYTGRYIVLEGISGSGKETQAKLLAKVLESQGQAVVIVQEPTEFGREILKAIKKKKKESGRFITQLERSLVFAVDRVRIAEEIREFLKSGCTVISVRSFLSSIAYQGENPQRMAEVLFLNRFMPKPDFVLLLEVEAKEALKRIYQRHEEEGIELGDFEELNKLKEVSGRFRQTLEMLPGVPVKIISANEPVEKVFTSVQQIIDESGLF